MERSSEKKLVRSFSSPTRLDLENRQPVTKTELVWYKIENKIKSKWPQCVYEYFRDRVAKRKFRTNSISEETPTKKSRDEF